MITQIINESKTITKHVPCKCKCKFYGERLIQIKSGIMINAHVSLKNLIYVKRVIFVILLLFVAKMVNI